MLHTVQVASFRGDVTAALSNINMMTWLDTRGSHPVIFQQAAGESEALAFVCAFGGRLVRAASHLRIH
jgi:hypothetical protein